MPTLRITHTRKIRILLVVCRLEGDRVRFHSGERRLIRGINNAACEPFYLEVAAACSPRSA